MNSEEKDLELIERYMNNRLTRAEAEDFETRLCEDHEFARKLRLRKNFPSLFKAEGRDEIVMTISDTPEVRIKEKKVHFLKTRHIVWGAVILLSAGIIIYFLFIITSLPVMKTGNRKPAAPLVRKVEARVLLKMKATESLQFPVTAAPFEPMTQTPEKASGQEATVPVTQAPEKVSSRETAAVVPRTPEKASSRETAVPVPRTPEKASGLEAAADRHTAIALESPANNAGIKRGEEIVFRWKQSTDSFTNFYIISESNNKLAWWRGIKPGIRELTVPAGNFKPGRFYWYVGTRENRRTFIVAP